MRHGRDRNGDEEGKKGETERPADPVGALFVVSSGSSTLFLLSADP